MTTAHAASLEPEIEVVFELPRTFYHESGVAFVRRGQTGVVLELRRAPVGLVPGVRVLGIIEGWTGDVPTKRVAVEEIA